MHQERRRILWLVSWYPNKWDAFDGDFIQRHARAAALYHNIHVLFVKGDTRQHGIEEALRDNNGLTEQIIYLPNQSGLLGKLYNHLEWAKHYKTQIGLIVQRGKPACVHVHVPWKVGLMALWAKRKFKLPFIVTEHWGIYNGVVEDNINNRPLPVRVMLKKILRHAQTFVSVSNYVGDGVNKLLIQKPYTIIPNVVDEEAFRLQVEKAPVFTFLHVSNMVSLKNVEGILYAFQTFAGTGRQARMVMIGNRDNKYVRLADDFGLSGSVTFFGEISHDMVAAEMRQSHVFVLNSNIENSPCVLGEALCCGLPVIATAVGGVPELVGEANGYLVPPKSNAVLAAAMVRLYDGYMDFDREGIAHAAQAKFGTRAVAVQFNELYQALNTTSTD